MTAERKGRKEKHILMLEENMLTSSDSLEYETIYWKRKKKLVITETLKTKRGKENINVSKNKCHELENWKNKKQNKWVRNNCERKPQ